MKICILIQLAAIINYCLCFELFTAAIVGVGSIIGKYTYCKLKECCTVEEIPAKFRLLEYQLQKRLYGQHLVQDIVVNALKAHWTGNHAQKPLTMSFHGWPGGGKNYVARFIEENLYKKGSQSDHVHHFMGRIHFPSDQLADQYKRDIYEWVKGNVTRCPRQLFVFDEVDKMPSGVLDGIKNIIDYNSHVEKVDYREAVFIFLSNTGASLITEEFLSLWRRGVARKDITLNHFENLILKGAFNEQGGFQYSDTIKNNLIDHYVPFLPLEEEHVRMCILDEFDLRGVNDPEEEHIKFILESVEWGPAPELLFSKTGCKRLSQKVAFVVQKHYDKHDYN